MAGDGWTAPDLDRRGAPEPAVRRLPFLFAALHCDEPHLGGARWRLDGTDEVAFVRAPRREAARAGKTLTIGVPEKFVSRAHARLVREGEGWVVIDEGSRNGTFLNGDRVTRAPVADRDLVEVGHTFFVLREAMAAPESALDDLQLGVSSRGLATLVPELQAQHVSVHRIAPSQVPVLLLGESGSGKEIAARAVHELSGRSGPFVPVNCGALPRGLVESQLFGHRKGAFSGALRDEPGYFRASDGGTLFLDEIGDLPSDAQTALLRVLEDRVVVPVGSTSGATVDVRVVAATHRMLREHVEKGSFRHDLFARLSGFVCAMPPLRDRIEDLGIIAGALLADLGAPRAAFSVEAGLELLRHEWPYNVRELRQCLASSLALAGGGPILTPHLPQEVKQPRAVEEGLEQRLVAALERHAGNVSAVARDMGKAPAQVNRWMKRFQLDPNVYRKR